MSIEPKYIRAEGMVSKTEIIDFPSYFLDLLLGDDRLSSFILAAKLPGEKEYRDARRSSQIGKAAGVFTGISWEKMPVGLMLFDGCSVTAMMFKLGKWWAHMMYFTPELRRESFANAVFKPKMAGSFGSRKMVGVEIKADDRRVPGLSDISKDNDLNDKILTLLKSDLVVYKDYKGELKGNEIRFTIARNPFRWFGGGKEEFGVIEIGLSTHLKTIQQKGVNYPSLCKMSFEAVIKIAEHLKPMYLAE